MKRKLVQQGSGALTMTLPIKWCGKHNLKQGSEIEVEETTSTLVVYAGEKLSDAKKETDITIRTKNTRFTRSILGALYRRGFDLIRVHYDDEATYQNIEAAVHNIIGYEIFEKRPGLCIIKSLVLENEKEYSSTVNKIINTTKTLQSICREDYLSGNHDRMNEVESYRQNAWKLRDYVMRIAIKTNNLNDSNYSMTLVVWVLEKINKEYKEFYQVMKEQKLVKSQRVLTYFDSVALYYTFFAESVNRSNYERVEEINTQFYLLLKEGMALEAKGGKQSSLITYLMSVVVRIQDISSFLVTGLER
jgi:hypothetical protein